MTKKIQRILSFILAVAMVLTVCNFSVFAEVDTEAKYQIKISETAQNHKYSVYQIFGGSITTSTEPEAAAELTDIVYGNGVDVGTTATLTAAALAEAIVNDTSDKTTTYYGDEIVKILNNNGVTLKETPTATITYNADPEAVEKYVSEKLPVGYYLIVDSLTAADGEEINKENAVVSSYIVRLLDEDLSIAPKSSVPEVHKYVTDVNDSKGETDVDKKTADYDIGDAVPFKLVGTLPTNYEDYTSYSYIFHDTLSKGLTYDADTADLKVFVGGSDTPLAEANYKVNPVTDPDTGITKLDIDFPNLKNIAEITAETNIVVTYNATLNENAVLGSTGNPNEVSLEFSNNPNPTGDGETGTTPVDTVIVFTYESVFNKIDGATKDALKGADFTLYKLTYVEDQTVTPSENLADKAYYSYNGKIYQLSVIDDSRKSKTNDDTTFTFKGIDDGLYLLVETETPTGYNPIDPLAFEVTAVHDDATLTLTSVAAEGFTTMANNEGVTTDIENNSGSTLPETGGMGTRIFYAVGGILVVAAGVLLISRRRMRNS